MSREIGHDSGPLTVAFFDFDDFRNDSNQLQSLRVLHPAVSAGD